MVSLISLYSGMDKTTLCLMTEATRMRGNGYFLLHCGFENVASSAFRYKKQVMLFNVAIPLCIFLNQWLIVSLKTTPLKLVLIQVENRLPFVATYI